MASLDRRGWLERLVSACLSILAGAAAVFVAVRLIEAVVGALLVIGAVALFIGVVIVLLRRRSSGW